MYEETDNIIFFFFLSMKCLCIYKCKDTQIVKFTNINAYPTSD